MNRKQKQELRRIEKQIIKTAHYVVGHGLVKPMSPWDGSTRDELELSGILDIPTVEHLK